MAQRKITLKKKWSFKPSLIFFPDKLGDNIFENLRHGFTKLCNRLAWNLYFETRLNKTYGRIFRLYYETLALHPFKTSKWLYNSLGLTYTSEVNAHVHHLTRAGVPDDCPTCAVRANSSAHVHSWKKIFNRTHLDEIKEVCGSYMKDLGYTWKTFLFEDYPRTLFYR